MVLETTRRAVRLDNVVFMRAIYCPRPFLLGLNRTNNYSHQGFNLDFELCAGFLADIGDTVWYAPCHFVGTVEDRRDGRPRVFIHLQGALNAIGIRRGSSIVWAPY